MKLRFRLAASALSAALLLSSFPTVSQAQGTNQVLVTNTEELIAALADVQAGDEIILREGIYQNDEWLGKWAAFFAEADGTEQEHIIIRSEDSENPATICGVSQDNKVALRIMGNYWEIRDLIICEASKGIFLEQSEHSVISGCEVYNIGSEAIHIIDGSSYNLVEDCYIHDAGTVTPQYGEGVYIGSAKSTEGYSYECHYNTVRSCRFGPNIAADHVDIKEYTLGNVVEFCTFDGTGMKGENGGDSFVEIKGNNGIIRNNTGYRNGCEHVLYAFDLNVQLDGWGQNNKIYDNTVYMDTTDCYLVKEWNCSTQVFRNVAEPEGVTYSGNKTLQVLGFEMAGDANEDGLLDTTDVQNLQSHLLGTQVKHISSANADLYSDVQLNAVDLCILKRSLLQSDETATPKISVNYTEESAGKWRMCNGLGEREVTFLLSAAAYNKLNMGWGYWDPNTVNEETGSSGKWFQLSLGQIALDENGQATITVELPADVTSVALQVYDYLDSSSNSLDKDEVELLKVTTQ
ncbi:MAG: right-handed parallel beta-helix repeat-containing protein [Oscillospiraceae bacterium]|nr:right-handed parallel beta-helix repeat-containing protein [Oscillospiraceae bacterium]